MNNNLPSNLVIGNSKIHSSGIYAKEAIPKGAKVIEYVGEKITKEESEKRADDQLEFSKSNPQLGAVYIFVIFLTYLGVGVGLFSGIVFFGQPHFFAKLGSWLLIILGLINIKDYFFPQLPIHLRMPKSSNEKAKILLEKATLPAVIIAAFLYHRFTFQADHRSQ